MASQAAEIGQSIIQHRAEFRLSRRGLAKLQKTIRKDFSRKNPDSKSPLFGLSRGAVSRKEANLVAQAQSLVGNLEKCVRFLLEEVYEYVNERPVILSFSADAHNPFPLNKRTARHRVSVGLYGVPARYALNLSDKPKARASAWWTDVFIPDVKRLTSDILFIKDKEIRIVARSFLADHGEYWTRFHGCGGNSQKSVFCTEDVRKNPFPYHSCRRLTMEEMAHEGYVCDLSKVMHKNSYAQPPPLHDLKGIGISLFSHTESWVSLKDHFFPCSNEPSNFTGSQVREMMRYLFENGTPTEKTISALFDVLVFFRFQNLNIGFWSFNTPQRKKMYVFSLFIFHALCVIVSVIHPGLLNSAGSTYWHSMYHAFDRESDVPFTLSDEHFEHINGMRKKWYTCCSKLHAQRDLMIFELQTRKIPPPPSQTRPPHILTMNELRCCRRCLDHESWSGISAKLRLVNLESWFEDFDVLGGDGGEGACCVICICDNPAVTAPQVVPSQPKQKQQRPDPAFKTEGYVSQSQRFKCVCLTSSGEVWSCGQKEKLVQHQKTCKEFRATQTFMDAFIFAK